MTKFIRKKIAAARVGWHPVHLMRKVKTGEFPAPVRIGPNSIAFVEEEVEDWLLARVAERDKSAGQVVKLNPCADARQPETSNLKDSKNDRTNQNRNSTSHTGE